EKIHPWSDPGAATADLAVRVEKRIGARLDALETRLDDMAVTIENRAIDAMSDDLAVVAEELRKAVGELGRLLVRDRGRISHALTEHRNAIIAEIRMPASDWEPSAAHASTPWRRASTTWPSPSRTAPSTPCPTISPSSPKNCARRSASSAGSSCAIVAASPMP